MLQIVAWAWPFLVHGGLAAAVVQELQGAFDFLVLGAG